MRKRILTLKDREIVKYYLESGLKLEGFHVFVNRLKDTNIDILKEDIELIQDFKVKIQSK